MKSKFCLTQAYTKDTGLVIVLILLLAAYWTGKSFFLPLSIAILLVVMTVPVILKPLAFVWYHFSMGLGKITNRIILTVVFVGLLIPVGVIRRCLGFDPMKRKAWKNGRNSVFTERNHIFTADDFNRPY
ncbi:MAG: membrane protein [Syntrophaceae bacterium]|nr:MAG: membrane protein [Syntrophaceae bacterium]